MFRAAEIGPSEKFGKLKHPFAKGRFCEEGLGEEEISNGSDCHAAEEGATEVYTFNTKCPSHTLFDFSVSFWSKQLTSC